MPDEQSKLGDTFDRMSRALTGLPDTVHTKPSTVVTTTPLIALTQTFIIQTYRQREQGDIVFLQYIGGDGTYRIVLPPEVADVIARQRDALSTKNRRAGARQAVQTKRAMGIDPAAALRKARAQKGKRKAR